MVFFGEAKDRGHVVLTLVLLQRAVPFLRRLSSIQAHVPPSISLRLLLQIASVISSFTIGPERVAAAALLFTRAADGHSQLHQLMQAMSCHDLLDWQRTLGAYAGYCWNQPTGDGHLQACTGLADALACIELVDVAACAVCCFNLMCAELPTIVTLLLVASHTIVQLLACLQYSSLSRRHCIRQLIIGAGS